MKAIYLMNSDIGHHWFADFAYGWNADCIRHDYASLAENAYPEAYSQFKHSMLLLIFDEELQTSPVKQDWSLQTRSELAGMLCRTLRQTAGISFTFMHAHLLHECCMQQDNSTLVIHV